MNKVFEEFKGVLIVAKCIVNAVVQMNIEEVEKY